jgi:DNA-binding MarR family transcriptional regulator
MSSQVLSEQTSETAALEAWVRLIRGHAAARRELTGSLQAAHGLTVNQYEALLFLTKSEGGIKRIDLATELQLTPSGITRLLDGLEAEGLVAKESCAVDARVSYAVITDAGRERLKEASCSQIAAVRELFEERYSPEELQTLADLLGKLPGAGNADGSECRP